MLALMVQRLLKLLRCDALLFEKQLSNANSHLYWRSTSKDRTGRSVVAASEFAVSKYR
jgi:hypothetical protein